MSILDDPTKVWGWFENVKSDRGTTEGRWQEISDHIVGGDSFTSKNAQGVDRMTNIYDTTGLYSNQLLAGTIHGLNTNPATMWAEAEPEDKTILRDPDAAFWFDDSSRRMMHVFNSPKSNFATQVAMAYMDIPAYGGSCMGSHKRKDGGIGFSTRCLSEAYFEENDDGDIDTVFREQTLRATKFVERYGRDAHEKATEAVDKGNHKSEFKVVQLSTRNDHPYAGESPFVKPWVSIDLLYSENKPKELARGGHYTKPWCTPRWEVRSGENYGRGPGWNALPDCRMLNAMALTAIKYAQKATDPPLLVTHQAVMSGLRMHPGGVTYVQDRIGVGGSGDAVRTLDVSRARPEIGYKEIEQRQGAVRNAFWSQLLQLFEHPNMTATQVLELASQVMRLMAPMMGRIQKELIEPMLERTFDMMLRTPGMLLPVPTVLKGVSYKLAFVSPIARAQRQSEAEAVMKSWEANAQIAQASQSQDALDVLDPTESAYLLTDAFGVPSRVIRDVREIQAERAERAQLTEQDATINQSQAGANVLKTLSEASAGVNAEAA